MTMAPALIADIGGTHARFALVAEDGTIGDMMVLRCREFAGPAEAAQEFLSHHSSGLRPKIGAFAVASALNGDWVDLTNSAWRFSIEAVCQQLGLARLDVVNDFTAVALSVRHLEGDQIMALGGTAPIDGAPIAVLGPGTGLGVSGLVQDSTGGWVALATEGGHVTMAATCEREEQVLAWLREVHGHVSAERVLSGPGLVNLYLALCALDARLAVADITPPQVLERAVSGSCPQCRAALDMFFGMMGTVAGNLALSLGAKGGVYIAGGILPRVKEAFAASCFRSRFEAKGRFRAYLADIPVWLITHPEPAFAGLRGLCSMDQ